MDISVWQGEKVLRGTAKGIAKWKEKPTEMRCLQGKPVPSAADTSRKPRPSVADITANMCKAPEIQIPMKNL